MKTPSTELFVALDFADSASAVSFARNLTGRKVSMKIGLELFAAAGPSIVKQIQREGFGVFLDLKLHDIPNTVIRTVERVADLGVDWFTVHAAGGRRMIEGVREMLDKKRSPAKMLAVTVLTSFSEEAWSEVLNAQYDSASLRSDSQAAGTCATAVMGLARLAERAGAHGMVCSPHELGATRGIKLEKIVPGIRLEAMNNDDQARVMTPTEARAGGARGIVVGRPITQATDPLSVVDRILEQLR